MTFFAQIVMAILALGMMFFYINPTFTHIGVLQDSIVRYQEEKGKVDNVNATLAGLKQKINNIPLEDQKSLLTYLPEDIDQMSVSRDILTMSEDSSVFLKSIRYDKSAPVTDVDSKEENLLKHTFALSLVGDYENVKSLLEKFEINNYPLEIKELTISTDETGSIVADVILNTYSYSNTNTI